MKSERSHTLKTWSKQTVTHGSLTGDSRVSHGRILGFDQTKGRSITRKIQGNVKQQARINKRQTINDTGKIARNT